MKPEYEKKLKEIQQKRVNWKREAEEFLTRNDLIIDKSIIIRREPQVIKILCDKILNENTQNILKTQDLLKGLLLVSKLEDKTDIDSKNLTKLQITASNSTTILNYTKFFFEKI